MRREWTDRWQSQNKRLIEKKKLFTSSMCTQPPQLKLPNLSCWALLLLRHPQHVQAPQPPLLLAFLKEKKSVIIMIKFWTVTISLPSLHSFDLSDSIRESGEDQKREPSDSLSALPDPNDSPDVATSSEVIDMSLEELPQHRISSEMSDAEKQRHLKQ